MTVSHSYIRFSLRFSSSPQLDHPTLEPNCLIYYDGTSHIFPVEIASSKSVDALKEAIKEKKVALQHVDADALALWKVSIPVDYSLEENVKARLKDAKTLSPMDILSDIFLDPEDRRLTSSFTSPILQLETAGLAVARSLPPEALLFKILDSRHISTFRCV
jgi:hypothetical protein